MNANDFRPWMEGAVSEVLEAMCFISTEGDILDDDSHYRPDWVCSRLNFKGNPSGSFGLAVSPETASTIAANFLGEDEPCLDEVQTIEVICELTNMVCGTLLAQLESKKTFNLSAPLHDSTGVHGKLGEDRIAGTFMLDEGSIYAWLEIQNDIQE